MFDERLVIAEAVLDRDSNAVAREDLRGDPRGPRRAGCLCRHDRDIDRRLAFAKRRAGPIDLHELGAAVERARDDVADRTHAQDRHAHAVS